MFENHFGLRENPFASGHQPRFVYPSPEHQEALAHLRFGIENAEPFVLITGEVGTGKTTALFEALGQLQARLSVAFITNSALTRSELLEEICLRFGFALETPLTKPQAMAALEKHLLAVRRRGDRAILLLDEAQNLERELLEEIRLLSNLEADGQKLLQIFLVGQPELEARLSRPELRQLRQRIAVHYRLRPLSAEDTERYIHHRITVAGGYAPQVFPHEACLEVYAVTNGIPREINQIASQAMLDAFVEGSRSVLASHVRSAAAETAFQSVLPQSEYDPRLAPPPRIGVQPGAGGAPGPVAASPTASQIAVSSFEPRPLEAASVVPITEPATAQPQVAPAPAVPITEPAPAQPQVAPTPSLAHEEPLPAATSQVSEPAEPPDEAARWESWLSSLTQTRGGDLRPAVPVSSETAAPTQPTPSASEPASAPRPAPSTAPGPAPIRPPIRYAAESAAEHVARGKDTTRPDWRPPLWTPEHSASGARSPSFAAPEEEETSNAGRKWLIGIAILAVVVIGSVLLVRFGPLKKHVRHPNAPTASAARREPAPAARAPSARESTKVSAPSVNAGTPALAPVEAPRAAVLPPVARGSATRAPEGTLPRRTADNQTSDIAGTAPTRPAPARRYGILVGTFLDHDRAEAVLARVVGASGIAGRIAPVRQDGVTMYAIVIGDFANRAAAERAASDLITKNVVDEARPVPRNASPAP